ncbi:MAG: hypothetical protein LW855_03910 [Alphaproteobacteria bacterium]|jgi:hypothetical protein|nr:hypothetical protein [Thalassospira sp.]MCE2964913.1 hypothetical protein [Alphaproteobacteria bacterium]
MSSKKITSENCIPAEGFLDEEKAILRELLTDEQLAGIDYAAIDQDELSVLLAESKGSVASKVEFNISNLALQFVAGEESQLFESDPVLSAESARIAATHIVSITSPEAFEIYTKYQSEQASKTRI